MGKRLSIEARLTTEELEQRYRAARDGVERSQWQIIWLLAGGATSQEVAAVTGYSLPWIRELAKRYNARGADGIGDGRHRNPGHAPLLAAEQQAALMQALEGPSPDGGRWSGPQVAVWIAGVVGQRVPAQRGWEYLRRLGFSPRVPRPRHAKADPAAQDAFKGGSWKQP
jgi:transposase